MKWQRTLLGVAALAFLLLGLMVGLSAAQGPRPPRSQGIDESLGTGFTYQGRLESGGDAVNDECDMAFRLYDDDTAGSQVGTAISTTVPITDGLFTVALNEAGEFGPSAFSGDARWLDIRVRCQGDVSYTDLGRQELTATPYALYAQSAPWSGLTGVPTGFADSNDGVEYHNVIVVAKSGGDYTSIQSALDSISDASASNPYLIWVAPGEYAGTVTMKPWVDIAGSGELVTEVRAGGSASLNTGTVVGADNAELRFVTVVNTGGNNYAVAIYNNFASPRLTHVTARASGATALNYGVYNYASAPSMRDVTASGSGGMGSYGVYNVDASSPEMVDVSASALWGADECYGVYNGSLSSPEMRDVFALGWWGSSGNVGVLNIYGSSPTMTNVRARAHGGSAAYGVFNASSSAPTMTQVIASAELGADNYGVYNDFSSPLMTNVSASARGGSVSYGVYNDYSSPEMRNVNAIARDATNTIGVYNYNSSFPSMTDVIASGLDGSGTNRGVWNHTGCVVSMTRVTASASGAGDSHGVANWNSSATIRDSVLSGRGATTYNYGMHNWADTGTYTVTLSNCQLEGASSTIESDAEFTTLVGASLLGGGSVVANGGTITCAGVYDEGYTFYTNTCP